MNQHLWKISNTGLLPNSLKNPSTTKLRNYILYLYYQRAAAAAIISRYIPPGSIAIKIMAIGTTAVVAVLQESKTQYNISEYVVISDQCGITFSYTFSIVCASRSISALNDWVTSVQPFSHSSAVRPHPGCWKR